MVNSMLSMLVSVAGYRVSMVCKCGCTQYVHTYLYTFQPGLYTFLKRFQDFLEVKELLSLIFKLAINSLQYAMDTRNMYVCEALVLSYCTSVGGTGRTCVHTTYVRMILYAHQPYSILKPKTDKRHTCMHACTCTHTHTHARTHTHMHTQTYAHTHTHHPQPPPPTHTPLFLSLQTESWR